jgi:hypothetical protein
MTPRSTAVLSCPNKPWDVQCILDIFCKGDAEDREVVKKLPRLTIHNRNTKQVHFKKYQDGSWVEGGFTSGGSAFKTEVWVNADTNCCEAAATLFHEVAHTDQPHGTPGSQAEYDAYTKAEQWKIKKGLPPFDHSFRKRVKNPNDPSKDIEVPNEDGIKTFVDTHYAYNPPTPLGGGAPPPRVLGLAPDGYSVRLSDGTTRPPQEGDSYRLPDTGGEIRETIDPARWKCS